MPTTSFHNPVRLLMGEGSFNALGAEAAGWGRRALLLTGRGSMERNGYRQRACELLAAAGVEAVAYRGVEPNPTERQVLEAAELARQRGCELVIGLGGGSAQDTAKAVAVMATHDRPLADFVLPDAQGRTVAPGPSTLPIICVTSTAGTSSQLTPFAVISLDEKLVKSALGGEMTYPKVGISDPELTYSIPPRVTAATGVDVLCHAMEGFFAAGASPVTDCAAERALRLVARWLPRAVEDGQDREARRAMSEADVFAGFPLCNPGGWVIHALEHPLSAHYPDLPHAEGLAALMPAYARLLHPLAPQKFAQLAEWVGAEVEGLSPAQAAARLEPALLGLLERVGLRVTLRDLGVEAARLEEILADTLRYSRSSLAQMPVPLSEEQLRRMLEESL